MPFLGALGGGGDAPSTPVIGVATAQDGSVSITFTPSTYIGLDTIIYTVTSSPGSFTSVLASSPIVVSGLTNGVGYTFTVFGTTNYGVVSEISSASNTATPYVPAPPPVPPAPCPPPGAFISNACVGTQLNYVLANGSCGSYLSPVGNVVGYCGYVEVPYCSTCLYTPTGQQNNFCYDSPGCNNGPGPLGYIYSITTFYSTTCTPVPCNVCVCPSSGTTGCDYFANTGTCFG